MHRPRATEIRQGTSVHDHLRCHYTLRTAAEAAERLGVDAKDASDWRATAERLLKSLPVKDGRFVPAADRPDAVSMGSLAGYFPFPIFPKGHKEQTAAVDFFLA